MVSERNDTVHSNNSKVSHRFFSKFTRCLIEGSLPYGGVAFGKAFPNKNFACFADGFHSCFEAIGDVPFNFRFDNLSPCVSHLGRGKHRIYGSTDIRGWNPRDKAMAETFERIRTILFPGKKTLLWGYVIHLMKNSRKVTYSNVVPFSFLGELESTGSHLGMRLGSKYAVMGAFVGIGNVNFGDSSF
jgi:Erythromycin esterase